jgi:hypothetical protein
MTLSRPWFGPKRHIGWGWRPVSWQGWTVTAIFLASAVTAVHHFGRTTAGALGVGGCLLAYFAVICITRAKPGGPSF